MSTIINDPDSLVHFLDHLLRFNQSLAEESAQMHKHWVSIGDVWRDAQYHRFGESLDEAERGIHHYLKTAEEHEHHLRALIDALEHVRDLR